MLTANFSKHSDTMAISLVTLSFPDIQKHFCLLFCFIPWTVQSIYFIEVCVIPNLKCAVGLEW